MIIYTFDLLTLDKWHHKNKLKKMLYNFSSCCYLCPSCAIEISSWAICTDLSPDTLSEYETPPLLMQNAGFEGASREMVSLLSMITTSDMRGLAVGSSCTQRSPMCTCRIISLIGQSSSGSIMSVIVPPIQSSHIWNCYQVFYVRYDDNSLWYM